MGGRTTQQRITNPSEVVSDKVLKQYQIWGGGDPGISTTHLPGYPDLRGLFTAIAGHGRTVATKRRPNNTIPGSSLGKYNRSSG